MGHQQLSMTNVVIGDNSIIGAFCELGVANHLSQGNLLIIEQNANIRSHSIFYEGSTFAEGLTTGHRVTVREKSDCWQKPTNRNFI